MTPVYPDESGWRELADACLRSLQWEEDETPEDEPTSAGLGDEEAPTSEAVEGEE
ncbi:MAG TPA: hypothetical protein QGF58_06940 [Myxococcota bacterium]|nr:hypothetical protein [Myxococcota bacterium]